MIKLRPTFVGTAICVGCSWSVMADGLTLKSNDSQPVKVQELDPFTHLANIPVGSDLSSIKFERVKTVRVATQSKSSYSSSYCKEVESRDPGGSTYCPSTLFQTPSPAYEVTFSYRGQPTASDEYRSNHFTFSVYLHSDELSPVALKTLTERKMAKSEAARFFQLNTDRLSTPEVVIDHAASTFCDGNFVDGSWMHADSKCSDKINYKTITAPSKYITVRVDPALTAAAANSPR